MVGGDDVVGYVADLLGRPPFALELRDRFGYLTLEILVAVGLLRPGYFVDEHQPLVFDGIVEVLLQLFARAATYQRWPEHLSQESLHEVLAHATRPGIQQHRCGHLDLWSLVQLRQPIEEERHAHRIIT
ncbi:hypothetical protein D3C75_910790 [compost metagenome]